MKKSELQNGMIVKSSGGRYGVVCLKDATDTNCIKFFYDPKLMIEHGSIERAKYGDFIVPLSEFDENLNVTISVEEARKLGLIYYEEGMPIWSIVKVFSLKEVWNRDMEV